MKQALLIIAALLCVVVLNSHPSQASDLTVKEQLTQSDFFGEYELLSIHTEYSLEFSSRSWGGTPFTPPQHKNEFRPAITITVILQDKQGQLKLLELPPFQSSDDISGIFGIALVKEGEKTTARIEFDPNWLSERKEIKVDKFSLVEPKVKRIWLTGPFKSVTDPLHRYPFAPKIGL